MKSTIKQLPNVLLIMLCITTLVLGGCSRRYGCYYGLMEQSHDKQEVSQRQAAGSQTLVAEPIF